MSKVWELYQSKMMKMSNYDNFMIGTMITFLGLMIIVSMVIGLETEITKSKCYDRYGAEIRGLDCDREIKFWFGEEVDDLAFAAFIVLGGGTMLFGVLFIGK